jgi:hypothetical protein
MSGLTQPRVENRETVAEWLHENGDTTSILLTAKSKEAYNELNANFGLPVVIVFNKQGRPIISSKGDGCQVVARSKISGLEAGKEYEIAKEGLAINSLEELMSYFDVGDEEALRIRERIEASDFIAFYSWAKFFPTNSKDMIEAVRDGLKQTDAEVLVLSANLDFIDRWADEQLGEKILMDLE